MRNFFNLAPNYGLIFDLDRTVINSDQRTPYFPNGDLDLAKYRELQTHENIMRDQLLPLAGVMQSQIANGRLAIVVTARRMTKSDYIYLRQNGMKPAIICSRDQLFKKFAPEFAKAVYSMGDSAYKAVWFDWIKQRFPNTDFTMYDDHKGVLTAAQSFGFRTFDAVQVNDMLGHFMDLGFMDGFAQGYDEGVIDGMLSTVEQVITYDNDQAAANLDVNVKVA